MYCFLFFYLCSKRQLSQPFTSQHQQCQHFWSDPPPPPKRADIILERSLMVPLIMFAEISQISFIQESIIYIHNNNGASNKSSLNTQLLGELTNLGLWITCFAEGIWPSVRDSQKVVHFSLLSLKSQNISIYKILV